MLFVHRIELYRKLQMTNKWRHFCIKKKRKKEKELIKLTNLFFTKKISYFTGDM